MASNVNVIKVTMKQFDRKLDHILNDLDMELTFRAKKYKITDEECCSFNGIHEIGENLKLVKHEFKALKAKQDSFLRECEAQTAELESRVAGISRNIKE